ncbi:cysteine synthase A [Sediminivirga luteola]|uniref:Cysteine synthase n=1 Tax=Sediminivirga luteola TaxID=1774748 RepID=A0A8J2U163_9MICO|nr:cysteine synthase A [Sediminivirga luteola]GGA28043.1 cysteine synthase [Sediminivirga luteola]
MPNIHESLAELVGGTPLLHLSRLFADSHARVLGKLEGFNPASSVKDRTALAIIRAAEAEGKLAPGGTIIEASSGNTGIALAWIGTALGYRVIIAMPDDVSVERRDLLRALGAEIVLTPGETAMAGANQKAGEILENTPGAFLAGQGGNPANPQVHESTTGPEIWSDTGGEVDALVATIGTGGTITGAGGYLRGKNPDLAIIGVEPAEAPVLNGGPFRPHPIQGIIGGDSIPPVLRLDLVDEVIDVSAEQSYEYARRAARSEGLLVGVSSGAALAAAAELAGREAYAGKTIVAVLPDTGERYLSTPLYEQS